MKDPKLLKPQGFMACHTGKQAEDLLIKYIEGLRYEAFDRHDYRKILACVRAGKDIADWCKESGCDQIYLHKVRVVQSIYELPWCIDFFIWNRKLWPKGLAIEVKAQNVGGSVDEKLPFIVFSMHRLKRPSGLLIVGTGFRDAAIRWVESQQNPNFLIWREAHLLRTYIETGIVPKMQKEMIKVRQAELF
jgi:hypothetical protein